MNSSTFKRQLTKATVNALSLFLMLAFASCNDKEKDNDPEPSESLYFSFKTPDWGHNIDCTPLDMPAWQFDSATYLTLSSGNPAPASFYFSYPKDSSQIVKPANLKQYSIQELGQHTGPFQLSLILPLTSSSTNKWLTSKAGQSPKSYNEILAVTYDGHNATEAFFKVKGKYQMQTVEVIDTSIQKAVFGTYHFRIRTTRK